MIEQKNIKFSITAGGGGVMPRSGQPCKEEYNNKQSTIRHERNRK
jgi:hypothetical protein